jgi:hypothetical protein
MANTYQPWQVFTNEALMILKNDLTFLKGVSRDNQYLFAKPGMKSGNTVNVRYPARYVGRTGEAYAPEAYTETSFPLTVRPLQGVDIDAPSTEWTLNINQIKEDVLRPAMAQLKNNIERDCLQIAYQGVSNYFGTLGTQPATSASVLQCGVQLTGEGFAKDNRRRFVLDPQHNASLVPGLQGLFNPQSKIGDQYESGLLSKNTLGFDFYESQNMWQHRIGPLGGTPAFQSITSTTTAGSTITTDGWTASAALRLRKGDIISIAAVKPVNPMTREPYGLPTQLRTFTVLEDVTSSGAGAATFSVYPPIIPAPEQFATVDVLPVAGALISVWGAAAAGQAAIANTYLVQSMAHHPSAFTFAGIAQEVPKGSTDVAYSATDAETGIQLRFARQWNGRENIFINRFDVLYAFGVPYGTGAVRLVA